MADQSHPARTAEQAKRDVLDAALAYAGYGWRIAPGSTWSGSRWERLKNGTREEVGKLRPLMSDKWATTELGLIRRTWGPHHRITPTIMLMTGGTFDVVAMPMSTGVGVRYSDLFRRNLTPVVFRPDLDRAYFLTSPGTAPGDGFGRPGGGIDLLKPNSLILAPPASLPDDKQVMWWDHPDATGGEVIAFEDFDQMLRELWTRPQFGGAGDQSS